MTTTRYPPAQELDRTIKHSCVGRQELTISDILINSCFLLPSKLVNTYSTSYNMFKVTLGRYLSTFSQLITLATF